MRKLIGFVITAGHMDIEWYQPLRSYRFWTAECFKDLFTAARRDDFGVYVLDGQVFPLLEHLEIAPEDGDGIKRMIKAKKLAIGPFYTQFDEWLSSPENIIRNGLYGRSESLKYGGCMRAGYLPDNFGHPRQLPQILRGFGIDSLLFMRGMPEVEGGHPDEFFYEGIDGSKVFACHFRESYNNAFDIYNKPLEPMQPRDMPYYDGYISFEYHRGLANHDDPQRIAENMIKNVRRIHERYPSGIIPLIAGADHLPPQINIGETIATANQAQDEIGFIMGDAEEYVRLARGKADTETVYDMELIGSRYQHILMGALSTRSYLKRRNFACEALLERYAEPLCSIAKNAGYPLNGRLLDEAWRNMLINSAHDSIHGSSTDEVHTEMETRYAAVRQIAVGLAHDALAHIGSRQRFADTGRKIIAYAPVVTDFAQPVELWLCTDGKEHAVTQNGEELPVQILDRQEIVLNGADKPRNDPFPSDRFRKVLFMGDFSGGRLQPFCIAPGTSAQQAPLPAGDLFIENEFLRVDVAGALINLTDKQTGKVYDGLNLLEEEADAGDAWDFSPPWTQGEKVLSAGFAFKSKLAENGSVRSTLAVTGIMNVPARLNGDVRSSERAELDVTFHISIYRGIKRVDVKLSINNTAKDHRVSLKLPMGVRTNEILSQSHFAVIKRPIKREPPTETWIQPQTQILPFREWLAAVDGTVGLAVAVKGLCDYEAITNPQTLRPDVRLTLVRGVQLMGRINMPLRKNPASEAIDTPGAQCLGIQEIEWSYLPYAVSKNDISPFLPTAQSFLYPPAAHAVRIPEEKLSGDIDFSGTDIRWSGCNIQFSAFKPAHNAEGYVLRLYENQGRSTDCEIHLGLFKKAWLAGMDEKIICELPVDIGCANVNLEPYKVVTLVLK